MNKGMTTTDVNAVEQPTKSMLSMGASQLDVKSILLNLVSKGFKDNDLGSLVGMVSDLMKSGSSANSSAGVVNQAIQQASALGLKGKDLLSKVGTIVNLKALLLKELRNLEPKMPGQNGHI